MACEGIDISADQRSLAVSILVDELKIGRFAVRRFESGYRTRTTSPRSYGIVSIHFRTVPVFRNGLQTMSQIGRLIPHTISPVDPCTRPEEALPSRDLELPEPTWPTRGVDSSGSSRHVVGENP